MARHTSRMGMVTLVATSLRAAMRPGSAGLAERAAAVPRMLSAALRGEYRGTTYSHVALLAAAVVYIVSPLDFVPEALFGVFGVADDAVVVTWLIAALVNDTEAYLHWERSAGAHGFQDAGPGGQQDMSSGEWAQTVQGQVIR